MTILGSPLCFESGCLAFPGEVIPGTREHWGLRGFRAPGARTRWVYGHAPDRGALGVSGKLRFWGGLYPGLGCICIPDVPRSWIQRLLLLGMLKAIYVCFLAPSTTGSFVSQFKDIQVQRRLLAVRGLCTGAGRGGPYLAEHPRFSIEHVSSVVLGLRTACHWLSNPADVWTETRRI